MLTPSLLFVLALAANSAEPVVVVELFTSQGCSSCPPADRLLSRLRESEGVRVLPLSFHVDYWNYIGWTDPFSSVEWSDRQRSYARALGEDGIYTPQLVVQGGEHFVGSDERKIRRAIRQAAEDGQQNEIVLKKAQIEGEEISIEVQVDKGGEGLPNLAVVIYERNLETPVGRGENANRTLRNDYVVRVWKPVASLDPGSSLHSIRVPIDAEWKKEDLGVVCLAQDPSTMKILGASSRDL